MMWYGKLIRDLVLTDHVRCVCCGAFIDGDQNKGLAQDERVPVCSPRCIAIWQDKTTDLQRYPTSIDFCRWHWFGHIWWDDQDRLHIILSTPDKPGVLR